MNRRGIGDRVMSSVMRGAAGYAWPGAWSQDRLEQIKHLRHWTAVAIFRICNKVASLSPNVAYVHTDSKFETRDPRRAFQRAILGDWRYKKTMHAVKPHETVEPAGADHPLVRLFARPNAWDTAGQLWYELTMYLKLTGNGYLWVVPNRLGKPCELWVLPSHWVWPRWTPAGVRFYEIRPWVGPGILHIPEEEIIHIPYKSPIHKVDGWSPLSSGAEWIDVTEAIVQAWYWSFQNGAFPWGAIALGENYADPDEQQLDEIYARYVAKYQGVVNAGQPFIMPPGAKFQPLQINPTEMAFGESSERCRDNVLALFGVPKEVAGIQDAGTEIAMYGPMMQFVENAVAPELRLYGDVLTQFLARRWDDHLRVWWNNPVPDNPEQINKDLGLDMQYGLRTLNEARAIRGLETIDEPLADELLVNPKLVPLSQLGQLGQPLGGPMGGIPPALPAPGQEGEAGGLPDWQGPTDIESLLGHDSGNDAKGDHDDPLTNGTHGPRPPGANGENQDRQSSRFTLSMNGNGHRKGGSGFFGDCPRDEQGHCLPQNEADRSGHGGKPDAAPSQGSKPSSSGGGGSAAAPQRWSTRSPAEQAALSTIDEYADMDSQGFVDSNIVLEGIKNENDFNEQAAQETLEKLIELGYLEEGEDDQGQTAVKIGSGPSGEYPQVAEAVLSQAEDYDSITVDHALEAAKDAFIDDDPGANPDESPREAAQRQLASAEAVIDHLVDLGKLRVVEDENGNPAYAPGKKYFVWRRKQKRIARRKSRQKGDRDWPGDCPRDEHGYCKPVGSGDETGRDKPARKPAAGRDKPAPKPDARRDKPAGEADQDRTRRPDEQQPAEDADRTRQPEENPHAGQPQKKTRERIISLAAAGLELPQHGPLAKDTSPLGQALAEGKLVHAKPIAAGCNQATLMKLEGGQFGVYKSQAGEGVDTRTGSYESLRKGVPLGTQYLREVAAYRLAVLAGMDDLVPLTTFRNQGGEVGSIQDYVDAARSAKESSDPYDGTKDAARGAAFDYLLGSMDRHAGNWLVTDEGKLALIDNGLSFPTEYADGQFWNVFLWSHAQANELPLPNLTGLQEHWPAIEEVLKGAGIEDEAIALTKERFTALTSGQYKTISELPDPGHPDRPLSATIDAFNQRMRKAIADWEAANKERAERQALADLPTNREPAGVP